MLKYTFYGIKYYGTTVFIKYIQTALLLSPFFKIKNESISPELMVHM